MTETVHSSDSKYDVLVLGGGPGGYVAALRASAGGLRTALVEMETVGGMCLNWGCIPSKALIQSAKNLNVVRNASAWGIRGIKGSEARPDWQAMLKRSHKIVKKLTRGVEFLLKNNGVDLYSGFGRVLDRQRLQVNDKELKYEHLIIATGSGYELPAGPDAGPGIYSPKTIYGMEELPETLLIAGAGNVGVEFALLFAGLDVKVTLVEKGVQMMSYLDEDVAQELSGMLKRSGVTVLHETECHIDKEGIILKDRNGRETVPETDVLLWTPARKANMKGLETLQAEGLGMTREGYIESDEHCRTNLNKVYAVGDVNGRVMLAHTASREGSTAVEHILGRGKALNYELIPFNLYASTEIASVGLTEAQAGEEKYDYSSGKFNFSANGKALAEDSSRGFVKVIYEKKYGEILGVHIVSENATDLISEAVLAMQGEATIWDLAMTTHPHPTLSEAILEAAFKGLDEPLHTV